MYSINAYIVNLATSTVRKEYMQELLKAYSYIKPIFIEALDGRVFSTEEREAAFDDKTCYRRYGRLINGGEVGCTLSHFKCYKKLVSSSDKFVLILEDDVTIMRNLNELDWEMITKFMSVDEPRIMFLSGDYWYWDKKNITRVFSAVGSYAYLINRSAAQRIVQIKRPSNVADDWDVYKCLGVKLFAVYPYMVDANIANVPSEIQQEYWGNHKRRMSLKYVVRTLYVGMIKKYLVYKRHFESKVRIE